MSDHKKVSYMEGQMLLREAYDQHYGLFDYFKQGQREAQNLDPRIKRPIAVVAYHPAEDIAGTHNFSNIAASYLALDIYKHFGLSLLEYLDLPSDHAAALREVVQKRLDEQARITANLPKPDLSK